MSLEAAGRGRGDGAHRIEAAVHPSNDRAFSLCLAGEIIACMDPVQVGQDKSWSICMIGNARIGEI